MTLSGSPAAVTPRPEDVSVPRILPRLIYYNLRVGVGGAAVLIVVGLGLLLRGPINPFTLATEQGTSFSLSGLGAGLASGQAPDILLLGFLLLIMTPLIRVIISAGMFAAAHDRPFTILTLSVLALLGASVLVGAFP